MKLPQEDLDLLLYSMGQGFTKKKLAEWGLPYPSPAGWRQKLLAEHGLRFIGPHKREKGFTACKVPEFIQPIVDSIGSDHWNQLSEGNKQIIADWIARVIRDHQDQ